MEKYGILDINVGEPLLPEHIVIKEEVILPEVETDPDCNSDPPSPAFQLELIKEEDFDNSFDTSENDPLATTNSSLDLVHITSCYVSLHKGTDIEEILSCKTCRNLKDDHNWRCSFIEESLKYKYGFYCQMCNKKILTQQQYIQHMSSAHNLKKSHECETCNHGLKRLIALNAHSCAKNKNRTYKCVDCSQMLQQQISLKFHLFIHAHNKPLGYHLKKKEKNPPILITCEKCKTKFSSAFQYRRHWSTYHSTQKYYVCFICHGTFKFKNLLQVHLQDHVKINKTDNTVTPVKNDLDTQKFWGSQKTNYGEVFGILPNNNTEALEKSNSFDNGENFNKEMQEKEETDVPYIKSELVETQITEPANVVVNTYPESDSDSSDDIPLAKLSET